MLYQYFGICRAFSETSAETTRAFLGDEVVAKFKKLKKRCDPNGLLESDLYRRIFK